MQADNDEPRPMPDLPCLKKSDNLIDETENEYNDELEKLATIANEIDSVDTFRFFLQELLTRRLMNRKKEQLQFIIDQQYNLENMKGAFKALILEKVK
jgi:Na+/phosphate symporter